MPESSFPGVYVQELATEARGIVPAPTSVAAFVGRARRGPVDTSPDTPTPVRSWADYERIFGGLWDESPMSFAVHQFFLQGGGEARVVRVVAGLSTSTASFSDGALTLTASSPGAWGGGVEFAIDHSDGAGGLLPAPLFNLTVRHLDSAQHEGFARLSTDSADDHYVVSVLARDSTLLRAVLVTNAPSGAGGAGESAAPAAPALRGFTALQVAPGADGTAVGAAQVTDPGLSASQRGMYALERTDGFNLLVIAPYSSGVHVAAADQVQAASYCASRRAMLLADLPSSMPAAIQHAAAIGERDNVACFFPDLLVANPLHAGRLDARAPSGAVAGVIARTDARRGVWKAPAGREATVQGVSDLSTAVTRDDTATLNGARVNALRRFSRYGVLLWGARTRAANASGEPAWRYLSVRRLGFFIEESVARSTAWVVFEPNDEPLWTTVRGSVETFLDSLFRQGAFRGRSARDAYFVKCGRETSTSAEIANGVVQLQIGFAPLRPAEFVVLNSKLRTARG